MIVNVNESWMNILMGVFRHSHSETNAVWCVSIQNWRRRKNMEKKNDFSTSKNMMKFEFSCSGRPFRTFDVSFDPESVRVGGFCTDGTASDVDVDVWPLWSFLSGSGWFCSFCLSHFSPSLCLSFWLSPHNVQQGVTFKKIENIEKQIDLFSSFSSFSSSSSSSFSCQLSKGTGIHTRRIEETVQLQSCQAMSGHVRPCQAMSNLIFCFSWLGFFLFVILNVWGQPKPQLESNQMNPNEMIDFHDENKR